MPEQLLVGYSPAVAAARLRAAQIQVPIRIGFLVFSGLFCLLFYYLFYRRQKDVFPMTFFWIYFGITVGISLLLVIISIVTLIIRAKAARNLPQGIAAAVDRQGMWMMGSGMGWNDVEAIRVKRGYFGSSMTLRVARTHGEELSLKLENLDVMTGTIDAAVRAYSGGSHFVDTTRLGH
jgi:hypothetical protein